MGNKLYVDMKISQINDIIDFPNEALKQIPLVKSEIKDFHNLKVWRFFENEKEEIESKAVLLPNIKEDHFLLNSDEAYIILLTFKGKDDLTEISGFPTSLWGIVESSSNMTPRGLKYAFSTSADQPENLESFLLSKRNFKDSEYKFVLFIWNGKNCTPILKSKILMKAFDLDKKLLNPAILPYLYYGHSIQGTDIQPGKVVNLNDIINNTFEQITEDFINTPSSDTLINYHETVYLLQWLYPMNQKKIEKKNAIKNNKSVLFKKFNNNFLKCNESKSYYDCFIIYDIQKKIINEKKKEELIVNPKLNLEGDFDLQSVEQSREEESIDYEESSIGSGDLEKEETDVVNDMNIQINQNNFMEKSSSLTAEPKIELKKINIGEIYNKTNASSDSDKDSQMPKDVKVPKLMMSFQHKILNNDIISQRTKQTSEDEQNLHTLPTNTIKKASDKIVKESGMKIDMRNLGGTSERKFVKKFDLNLSKNLNCKIEQDELRDLKPEESGMRESERKQVIMDYFSKTVSEIIEKFLYISSYNVAKNKDLVYSKKITHIINAAGDICCNHFENEITYLTFNLKDHAMENIECLFYEVINFMEEVRKSNGRVLVHCIQGISRSVTLVIAYLIYKRKINYEEAFQIVQEKRSIVSPNLGFSIQLQNFYQRLFEPPESFRLYPKIFAVGCFQPEQPHKIVCRLMNEAFYEGRGNCSTKVFDKRGIFIVTAKNKLYLWYGSKIFPSVKKFFVNQALNYVKYLQENENASKEVLEVKEGNEPDEFISIWFNTQENISINRSRFSEIVSEWNNWYKDVDVLAKIEEDRSKKSKSSKSVSKNQHKNQDQTDKKIRKAFYIYPDIESPVRLVDLDDLSENDFLVACYANKDIEEFSMHIWQGDASGIDDDQIEIYVSTVKFDFFEDEDLEKVVKIEEMPFSETDDFMNMLS